MTVKELIEALHKYDDDDIVTFCAMLDANDDVCEVYDIIDITHHLDIVELHPSMIISS